MITESTIIAAKQLKSIAQRHLARTYEQDDLFEQRRKELLGLCDVYADDPLNPDFLERGVRLISKFEDIASNKSSESTYGRAKVNAAVTAGRVRRTHYTSYLAGKYSCDKNIGADFKCWIYNAAAFSAIQLRKSIADGVDFIPQGDPSRPMLAAFANSAVEEATMYLDFADDHCENSVLTRFNKAVLEIYSGDKSRFELGLSILRSIEVPVENAHSAVLSWHTNNYECYIDKHLRIKEFVRIQSGHAAEEIHMRLLKNKEEADRIGKKRDDNGGRWPKESPRNLALVACAVFGSAVATTVFLTPEARQALFEIMSSVGELIGTIESGNGSAKLAVGDGGAAAAMLARVSFGDGGVA